MGKNANGKETERAVDERKVLKLVKFHRIRPLLFEYDKKTALLSKKNKEYLKEFVTLNALKNRKDIYHTKKLLQQFETAGIPLILHKGLQYQFEIYEDPQLRERGDIDVLIQKKDVLPSINILKKQGFGSDIVNPDQSGTEIGQQIEKLLSFNYLYQLPLSNKNLLLDFQWGVKSDFHSFHFPYPLIFQKAAFKDFYGIKTLQVDKESLFWLMIIHHGGKDQWMRLRHLADLTAYMKTYSTQIDWGAILVKAKSYGLQQVLLDGFQYLKTLLSISLPPPIENRLENHENRVYKMVFNIWETCSWGDSRFEITNMYIRYLNRDNTNFDSGYYIKNLQYHYEKKQANAFPEKYTMIDFLYDAIKLPIKILRNK